MEQPIFDPNIPYVGPIGVGGRFAPQKLVRIQGTVPGISYRFNINLQCGPNTSPQDDIALQISVRLLDGCICLNSLQHGVWDDEQRKTTVPIKRAEQFEIVILCEFNKFKVAINGQHYCEYPQRIYYDKISHLSIDGDVSIIQISYESAGGGSTAGSSFPMPVAPIANESDDFELLDNATAPPNGYRPPPSKFQPPPSGFPPPSSGFKPPPSGFYPPPTTGYPPATTGYPPATTGYPPPTTGYPPPNNSYPPNNPNYGFNDPPTYEETLNGPPYPSGAQIMHPQPIQPTYVPGLQPPPGTIIPLNAVGSNFQPVKRHNTMKACCTCFWIVVVVVVIIVAIVVTKNRKSRQIDPYNTPSDDVYSSYNNNNYNYNNYGSKNNYWDNN